MALTMAVRRRVLALAVAYFQTASIIPQKLVAWRLAGSPRSKAWVKDMEGEESRSAAT